jgi:hypothetical protein
MAGGFAAKFWAVAGGQGMSQRGAWLLVLAAPFFLFLVLLVLSPPDAGWFAGSALVRLTDPLMLFAVVASGIAGSAGVRWFWALGIGIATAFVLLYVNYDYWVRIAGHAYANNTAFEELIWHLCFAFYGFLVGRLLLRSPKPAMSLAASSKFEHEPR